MNVSRIVREKTCPFLLRLFYKTGRGHALSEFEDSKMPPENEEV